MVHHYKYSTINSHHKVLVNLQDSNMDALSLVSIGKNRKRNLSNITFLSQA